MTIEPESAKATPIPFNPLHFGAQLPREGKSNSRVEALEKLAEIPPDVMAAGSSAIDHWLKRSVRLSRDDIPETMGEIRAWALNEIDRELRGRNRRYSGDPRTGDIAEGFCASCGRRVMTAETDGELLCMVCMPLKLPSVMMGGGVSTNNMPPIEPLSVFVRAADDDPLEDDEP